MYSKPLIVFVLFALCTALLSCTTSKIGFKGAQYPYFKTFDTPRTGHAPGYIFRIKNGDKKPIPVTQIDVSNSVTTQTEDFPEYYKEWSLNTFLKFLVPNYVKANAELDKKLYSVLEIGNGKRETVFEDVLNKAISAAQIDFKDDSRYYVIQETIATKSINYKVLRKTKLDGAAEEQLKNLEAQGKIKLNGTDIYQLKQDYDNYYRLFYTVLEINRSGTLIAGGKDVQLLKVKEDVTIPSE